MSGGKAESLRQWHRILEFSLMTWLVLWVGWTASFIIASMSMPTQRPTFGTRTTAVGFGPQPPGAEVGSLFMTLFFLATPVFGIIASIGLYKYASLLREADLEWDPSPRVYAILALIFSGIVVSYFFYKRYKLIRPEGAAGFWRYPAALLVAVSFIGVVALFGGVSPTLLIAAILINPVMGIAIYFDAKRVSATSDWNPNPAEYLGSIVILAGFLSLPSIIGTYYLYKRETTD